MSKKVNRTLRPLIKQLQDNQFNTIKLMFFFITNQFINLF
jgi:hypothetical protein